MKSDTELKEQQHESVQEQIVIPPPETTKAVAKAKERAVNLVKKRVDVKHMRREDKLLVLPVPPYEIRLFGTRPEPVYALYAPGPRTGRLPKRSDQYLIQGSLMFLFRKLKELLLADGFEEGDGTIAGIEKVITLSAFYLEDFLVDALSLISPDRKQLEESRTIKDKIDKLGKAGEKTI